jgi:hypothetical protein
MDEKPWPAITFQGFFLAIDVGLIVTKQANDCILWSFAVLMALTAIQMTSNSPRFLWLYPVNRSTDPPTKTAYVDTWVLRGLLLLGTCLLAYGLTGQLRLIIAVAVGVVVLTKVWDWLFDEYRIRYVKSRINKNIEKGAKRVPIGVTIPVDQLFHIIKSIDNEQKHPPTED